MIYFIFLCLIHSDKPLKQKNIKLILRFNKVFRSNPIVRDFKRFNIKNDSLSSNHFTLTKNDFDDIILDEKALCLIFNNLDLLSKNDKLKDVYIDKIAIFKENKDPWMKLTFKNNIDSTGYFRGEHTEKFNLEESMFFHLDDIDDETKRKNVINIKKFFFILLY
ncbi:hypothetical protein NCER_101655 [Vairimorpha ceranae BRL01]|uniref:Uncharacterized protein n=1 Tax=Vairimorpha ceranae (strain BRL01) TaxID=578460 RepID=C4VAI0_VAIC1|nr:hypothetical protein NCER_101655 [Vairimorpha ceranae BRL01]